MISINDISGNGGSENWGRGDGWLGLASRDAENFPVPAHGPDFNGNRGFNNDFSRYPFGGIRHRLFNPPPSESQPNKSSSQFITLHFTTKSWPEFGKLFCRPSWSREKSFISIAKLALNISSFSCDCSKYISASNTITFFTSWNCKQKSTKTIIVYSRPIYTNCARHWVKMIYCCCVVAAIRAMFIITKSSGIHKTNSTLVVAPISGHCGSPKPNVEVGCFRSLFPTLLFHKNHILSMA